MKVTLAATACKDLRQAHEHIGRDNPLAAAREVTRILQALQDLADTHVDGREVVLDDGRRVRLWLVSSYRVYYRNLRNWECRDEAAALLKKIKEEPQP